MGQREVLTVHAFFRPVMYKYTFIHSFIHFKRNPIAKTIKTETEVKKYGLVFDKRVPHVGTFKSYPYGYAQFTEFDAQDILNIETLI